MALDAGLLEKIVTGGDDYEVLASVGQAEAAVFERSAAEAGVAIACVGKAFAGDGAPVFLGPDGLEAAFEVGSFSHF